MKHSLLWPPLYDKPPHLRTGANSIGGTLHHHKDQVNTYKLSADRWLVRFESGVLKAEKISSCTIRE